MSTHLSLTSGKVSCGNPTTAYRGLSIGCRSGDRHLRAISSVGQYGKMAPQGCGYCLSSLAANTGHGAAAAYWNQIVSQTFAGGTPREEWSGITRNVLRPCVTSRLTNNQPLCSSDAEFCIREVLKPRDLELRSCGCVSPWRGCCHK